MSQKQKVYAVFAFWSFKNVLKMRESWQQVLRQKCDNNENQKDFVTGEHAR